MAEVGTWQVVQLIVSLVGPAGVAGVMWGLSSLNKAATSGDLKDHRSEVQGGFKTFSDDIRSLRSELKGDLTNVSSDMRALRTELTGDIKDLRTQLANTDRRITDFITNPNNKH